MWNKLLLSICVVVLGNSCGRISKTEVEDEKLLARFYVMTYSDLENKLKVYNDADPFDKLIHKKPIELFKDAGISNFHNVSMTYDGSENRLFISAPKSFHDQVEIIIGVKGIDVIE
ncbi:MAG: hypothetical protein QM627_10730 [Luteolibacter sp.]